MIKQDRLRITLVLVMLGLLTVFCADFSGETPSVNPITASLTEFSGRVQVMKASKGEFEPATSDFFLEVNDQVLTGEDGRARIDISDGTIVRLSPLSNFVLSSMEETDEGTLTRLQLNIGRLWIILRGGVVEVDTPSGLASVRGSYLHVWVDPLSEETNVTCLEGRCTLGNEKGTVSLVAGQTARIRRRGNAPEAGKMNHKDVGDWLDENPEATMVVVPLTETVAANQGKPTPKLKTNTPTPTKTVGPSPTTGPTKTPTNTVEAADCGPPEGWVLHTIRTGETIESLAAIYRVDEADLRNANCRGEMDFVVVGEKFYVPNVATSTPTKTPTPTPLVTKTPKPTDSGGTSSNSPTYMSGPVGPDNEKINVTADCGNSYRIKATDADGLKYVKMIYTFDGTVPDFDTAISDGKYEVLTLIKDDVYGVSDFIIDTTKETAPVKIRFRFAAKDKNGNVTYFPTDDAYDLTDNVNCSDTPPDTPATYSNESGPDGAVITVVDSCQQTYTVDVVDPDGISWVKVVYSTDGSTPSFGTHSYHQLSNTSGATYEVTDMIETSGGTTTVKYRFASSDVYGYITHYPAAGEFSFSDSYNCGKTQTNSLTTPDGDVIGTTATCPKDYEIDVEDANGIAKVELFFIITDGDGVTQSTQDVIEMNLHTANPSGTGGLYELYTQVIDTSGFSPTPSNIVVDFDIVVTDGKAITSTEFTGTFADSIGCP